MPKTSQVGGCVTLNDVVITSLFVSLKKLKYQILVNPPSNNFITLLIRLSAIYTTVVTGKAAVKKSSS